MIGGAVAAVSYTVGYFASGGNKARITMADNSTTSTYKYDPTIGSDTMQNNINKTRKNFYYDDYGVGDETSGDAAWTDGTMNPGNDTHVLAYTTKANYFTGKSNIVYSPLAAQKPQLLAETMIHETGHALSNKLRLLNESIDWEKEFGLKNRYTEMLDTTEEFAVYKLEHISRTINNYPIDDFIPQFRLDKMFKLLDFARQNLIETAYKKLMSVFQRSMK
ncbi:hypothetical protein [Chryseobacterium lathyri]|uniref:hypothetical protein n=1 Tax=Chryseobacterium lathyri TaxID=395933 RepID=UPI001CBE158B|nr:hypothetical protein [Chryseobacterium lathyri]